MLRFARLVYNLASQAWEGLRFVIGTRKEPSAKPRKGKEQRPLVYVACSGCGKRSVGTLRNIGGRYYCPACFLARLREIGSRAAVRLALAPRKDRRKCGLTRRAVA